MDILEDGSIAEADVIENSTPSQRLAVASISAVSFWRYKPPTRDGCPVPAHFTITIDFTLH